MSKELCTFPNLHCSCSNDKGAQSLVFVTVIHALMIKASNISHFLSKQLQNLVFFFA